MKTVRLLFLLAFASLFFAGCTDDSDSPSIQDSGIVVDYAGSGNCGFVIEMDNGDQIIPINYPDDFVFAHGQRVWAEYHEMPNIIPLCDKGAACEITSISEINCAPYTDLYFNNYDSLARDPVFVHEAYVDGDCLHLKLSYSGGCEEHIIGLARMHPWCGTPPLPPPAFEIRHNANGDMCEAYFTKDFRFDISPIRAEGATKFTLSALMPNGETFSQTFDLK